MDNKELIRKSLMGDREAQEECAEKGIALPCPFCGGNKIKTPYVCGDHFIECSSCHSASNIVSSRKQALKLWNTRPAPPIGRCGECKCWQRNGSDWGSCSKWYTEDKVQAFMLEDDFCSSFEPREDKQCQD